MYVWLLKTGEPLPIDEGQRLFRMGLLASTLVSRGHTVVWWTSTFDHFRKQQRAAHDLTCRVKDRFELHLIRSPGYTRNASLARILDHLVLAHRFARLAPMMKKPDLIVCSYPTIGLTLESCRFGTLNDIPVVLDVRDLWPDTFRNAFPRSLQPVFSMVEALIHKKIRWSFSKAEAIIGVTREYVSWGLSIAGRERSRLDMDFPLAYPDEPLDAAEESMARQYWIDHSVEVGGSEFVVCFFGTIGRHFDLSTVLRAARILSERKVPIKFVICGDGDEFDTLRTLASRCSNVIMPGWIGKREIWSLLRISTVAIAPYVDTETMSRNVPNKIQEYLRAGLPVLYSLGGNVRRLLTDSGAGLWYSSGDADELARILEHLYEEENCRRSMADKAKLLSQRLLSADEVYESLAEHLETIVASEDAH
jgi:glycosyltransferase involved in cell wall biosynthesis